VEDDSVITFEKPQEDPLTELIRTGARQLIEQAVQAELAELLERFGDCRTEDGRAGVVRNGYQPEREILTGVGPVSVKIPKVRSRLSDPVVFQSVLVPPYVRRSRSLEAAIPWLYLKGVSTGDMQSALEVLVGQDAKGLSPNVVGRLKRQWQQEYEAWGQQRLDQDRWVYVWADGIYSRLRGDADKLCVLVVIGVNDRGEKHFLAIEDGVRESKQSWREVLLKLKGRGLITPPKLAVGDGALGFWTALSEVYPASREQRCWMHKTGNVLNYLPKSSQPKAKKALQNIWMAETRKLANIAFDEFIATYEAKYPKAVECLVKDRDALLAFYDFPAEHWVHLRTTNPIESSFATIRHRTNQTKGCVTRDTMLAMVFKLGQCAEKNWRRIRGFKHVAKVIEGVRFIDGIEQDVNQSKAAA
jgi:transposase-like protein